MASYKAGQKERKGPKLGAGSENRQTWERETCHLGGKFKEEKERKGGRERSSNRRKAGREIQGETHT